MDRPKGVLIHVIRNRAVDDALTKTNAVSVETVVVETTAWAKRMKEQGLDTVDQELFHIVNAINSSPDSGKVKFFAGQIVTDNVSPSTYGSHTLESAQARISATAESREAFSQKFSKCSEFRTIKQIEAISVSVPERTKVSSCEYSEYRMN